ncbi:HTH domain-containing protein [Haloarchaeobius sp. TZWWS8]|uniref:HTH domain-containing protein n=1 Tax=Haloarchaeobius sp. TZWWS8 TaxID=3446121 RepID=UPI003EB9984E
MPHTSQHSTDERTAELWVRSHSPFGASRERATVLDSLESLESEGYFDDVTARLWGKRVGFSTMAARTEEGSEILDTVEEFRSWADRNGANVDQFFPKRVLESQLVEQQYMVQELPTLALAEYENGELVNVTPCINDGTVETVEDRISTIESDAEAEAREAADRKAAPARVQ